MKFSPINATVVDIEESGGDPGILRKFVHTNDFSAISSRSCPIARAVQTACAILSDSVHTRVTIDEAFASIAHQLGTFSHFNPVFICVSQRFGGEYAPSNVRSCPSLT